MMEDSPCLLHVEEIRAIMMEDSPCLLHVEVIRAIMMEDSLCLLHVEVIRAIMMEDSLCLLHRLLTCRAAVSIQWTRRRTDSAEITHHE